MFTTEFDHDEIAITILDENGHYEDAQFTIFSDIVYIQQWNEDKDLYETIVMSPDMFDEFLKSINLPEGAYYSRPK
jgi:hypothetical protein